MICKCIISCSWSKIWIALINLSDPLLGCSGSFSLSPWYINRSYGQSMVLTMESDNCAPWWFRCLASFTARASRDGFKAQEFHRRCDSRANPLTAILDTKGNIFNGFSSVERKWLRSLEGGWYSEEPSFHGDEFADHPDKEMCLDRKQTFEWISRISQRSALI
jgi:hypothetical protein